MPILFTGNDDNNVFVVNTPISDPDVSLGETFAGNDRVFIDADVDNTLITLGEDDDLFRATNTIFPQSTFENSEVRGDGGSDDIELAYRTGTDFTIRAGEDADFVALRSSIQDVQDFNNGIPGTGANYSDFFIGTDGGNDVVVIDPTVRSISRGTVNLGNNGNSLIGPAVNFLVDFVSGANPAQQLSDILEIDNEALYLAALNVDDSTFRGNRGSDVIILDGVSNIYDNGPFGTSPDSFTRNNVNAGADGDLVVGFRDLDRSTVRGGNADDIMLMLSGTLRFSLINGNKGADTMLVADILSQNSTVFGGQGEDDITVLSAVTTDSLFSGDKGDDTINFFALNSTNTTLRGGDGDDRIDDFSVAITGIGTVLEGGDGDDVLRQSENILFNGITDFGSTIKGGKGQDTMTGDLDTSLFDFQNEFPTVDSVLQNGNGQTGNFILNEKEVNDAASDLFRFEFGDSAINRFGVGADVITDFDSDRSLYFQQNTQPNLNNAFANVSGVDGDGTQAGLWGLPALDKDVIELVDADNNQKDIVIDFTGLDAGQFQVNGLGQVTSGANNPFQFVEAGASLTTEGAALIWTGIPRSATEPQPNDPTAPGQVGGLPVTSYLFISDGVAGLQDTDLLTELTNVAATPDSGGLEIIGGRITNIV